MSSLYRTHTRADASATSAREIRSKKPEAAAHCVIHESPIRREKESINRVETRDESEKRGKRGFFRRPYLLPDHLAFRSCDKFHSSLSLSWFLLLRERERKRGQINNHLFRIHTSISDIKSATTTVRIYPRFALFTISSRCVTARSLSPSLSLYRVSARRGGEGWQECPDFGGDWRLPD